MHQEYLKKGVYRMDFASEWTVILLSMYGEKPGDRMHFLFKKVI